MSDPLPILDLPADATTWNPPGSAPAEMDARKKFKSRVVPAWAAYSCCKKGYLRSAQYQLQLLEFVEDQIVNRPTQAGTAVLPKIEPFVRVTYKPAHVGYGKFFLTDPFGTIDPFDAPNPGPELQRLADFVSRATEVTKRTNQDCFRCVERALLSQSKARQKVTITKPSIGGDEHLQLRIPHR